MTILTRRKYEFEPFVLNKILQFFTTKNLTALQLVSPVMFHANVYTVKTLPNTPPYTVKEHKRKTYNIKIANIIKTLNIEDK